MSKIIRKRHNVSILMYHIVCPAKYRSAVITEEEDKKLGEICLGIEARYEIKFLEIGVEVDHVHFLVQSVPKYSPKQIVQTIKSLTARKIYEACPDVKKALWGGEFWTDGYYIGTVGEHGNEKVITEYVKNQGRSIKRYMMKTSSNYSKICEKQEIPRSLLRGILFYHICCHFSAF